MIAEEREDAEGDLVMAAEKITPNDINFMAREARGVISVAIPDKRFRELGIPLQPSTDNGDSNEQAGVLIDAREGATTGISAGDRARVISVVAFDESRSMRYRHARPHPAADGAERRRDGADWAS